MIEESVTKIKSRINRIFGDDRLDQLKASDQISEKEWERRKRNRQYTKNMCVVFFFMSVATLGALAFLHFGQNDASVSIIYVLAVMLTARYTTGYVAGILASLLGVFCVNFAFTYPYMKLNFSIDGYLVTFGGMMLVSSITSVTTTQLKQKNQILKERDKMLLEAEKETMRANLLRAVSHDLRTPLTGMIGMTNAYLEGGDHMPESDKREMVANIREDANWLLNMVENLLTVTRIQVGDAKMNTNPEPLEEVVSEAMMRFRRRLPKAKVRVSVPDEFLMIPMDAMLIEQVIINLLENAVYHSGVEDEIEFRVTRDEKNAVFHIRDFGKGIDPARLDSIFDGVGIDKSGSGDSHKGMGIGLTICKTIITAHHGTICALNHDRGAEFMFTLPLEEEKNE